jgi:hypothetical protein
VPKTAGINFKELCNKFIIMKKAFITTLVFKGHEYRAKLKNYLLKNIKNFENKKHEGPVW